MFVYVSNRPSLDLLGTLKWRTDSPEEHLHTPAEVEAWSLGSSLGPAVVRSQAEVARVREVREALYRVIAAARRGEALLPGDVQLLNELAAEPGPGLRLQTDGSVSRTSTAAQLLAALARDALDLLAGPELAQVRDCSNPRCTRLYVDVSRAGNRRWCGMAECGNTAKVAAFRARKKA